MKNRSFSHVLRELALALFNATVMLLVILLICGTIFLKQLNELRDSVSQIAQTTLAPQIETLDRLRTHVNSIDARLADANTAELFQIRNELQAIRLALPELSNVVDISTRAFVDQLVTALATRLDTSAQ